jgi:hypothetical protein
VAYFNTELILIKIAVFRDVAQCSLVGIALIMEAVRSSETSANI